MRLLDDNGRKHKISKSETKRVDVNHFQWMHTLLQRCYFRAFSTSRVKNYEAEKEPR